MTSPPLWCNHLLEVKLIIFACNTLSDTLWNSIILSQSWELCSNLSPQNQPGGSPSYLLSSWVYVVVFFFLIEWNTNTHFPIIFTTYGWKVFLSIKVARRCCSCRRYQELLQTVSWIFISVKSLKAIASFRRWKCHQFFKVLQQLESMRSNSKREVLG